MTHAWILLFSRRKRFADSCHDGIVVRKEDPAFLGDFLISDPHSELTGAAFDQFSIHPESVFDGGRHTGGAGTVGRSDFTETNSNFTHEVDYTMFRTSVGFFEVCVSVVSGEYV